MPTNSELCSLSFDDTEEITTMEAQGVQKRGRDNEGDGNWQSLLANSVNSITELLKSQHNQENSGAGGAYNEILLNSAKSLRTQEETNKLMLDFLNRQLSGKNQDEEFTREKAILFAFDAGQDDAETVIDHKVRNGIRPYRGLDWVARWESRGRHAKPRWESLAIPELGIITISPVVIRNMHDRGKDLKIAMFLHTNADVSVREGKFRRVGEHGREIMHEMFEWREPESTQSISEAVLSYTIALWRIWEEDWSGLVLLKILTRYKYLANARVDRKKQIALVSSYINAFFGLCAAAGRDLKPPPKYREAEQLMLEHLDKNNLDATQCRTGRDPYDLRPQNQPQPSGQQPRRSNQGQGGSQGQGQRQGGGQGSRDYHGNQHQSGQRSYGDGRRHQQSGQMRDIFKLPMNQLSHHEKLAVLCRDWNSERGCQDNNCKFKHQCSTNLGGGRLCLDREHNAVNHV